MRGPGMMNRNMTKREPVIRVGMDKEKTKKLFKVSIFESDEE